MFASLPMYDFPEVRGATDRWWTGLSRHMVRAGLTDVPKRLTRDSFPGHLWCNSALLFSQTCGYPLTHAIADNVHLLGTPVYAAPGCHGPRYASVLVVNASSGARHLADLRGGVCAVNAVDSHSGYNVLRAMVAPLARGVGFFSQVVETGSHVASLVCVGEGGADLCAVDCVTYALVTHHKPNALAGTRALAFSPSAPGLPYVAGSCIDAATRVRMQRAIDAALDDPALIETRAALLIAGWEELPLSAYSQIKAMAQSADALAYPRLE